MSFVDRKLIAGIDIQEALRPLFKSLMSLLSLLPGPWEKMSAALTNLLRCWDQTQQTQQTHKLAPLNGSTHSNELGDQLDPDA